MVGTTTQRPQVPAATGVCIGEGVQPVPLKIADKIWAWEFVDMADLLPEQWSAKMSTGRRMHDIFLPGGGEASGQGHGPSRT